MAVAFHILSNVVRTPLSWCWRRGIVVVAAGASGQRATGYPYYHHHDNATLLLLLVTRCQAVAAGDHGGGGGTLPNVVRTHGGGGGSWRWRWRRGLVKCGEDPRWWRGIMAVAAGACQMWGVIYY